MATKSTRNLSFEQAQAMWPGITFNEGETFTVSSQEPMSVTSSQFIEAMLPSKDPYNGWLTSTTDTPSFDSSGYDAYGNFSIDLLRKQQMRPPQKQENLTKLMTTEAVKADSGKPDWSLVPFEALEGMVRVLEFGANKYSRNNWMTGGGFSYRRVLTACVRHLFSYMGGEDKDPESGLSHIHHAQCNLLFLAMYLTNREKFNKDDRESR